MLQGDPVFGELTENITLVIRYFNNQVEKARGYGGWDWSVEKVLDVIKGALTASLPVSEIPASMLGALLRVYRTADVTHHADGSELGVGICTTAAPARSVGAPSATCACNAPSQDEALVAASAAGAMCL